MCINHWFQVRFCSTTFASMRVIPIISCLISLMFVTIGCEESGDNVHQAGVFELEKLAGRWEFMNNDTHQIEEWFITSNKELHGRGFVLEEGDTTFIEFLTIRESNGVLTYFAQISDMNSSEVVPFTLSAQTKNSVEFSNQGQDFPKTIGYEMKSDSVMLAYIEGPRDGQSIRILFNFEKQQE